METDISHPLHIEVATLLRRCVCCLLMSATAFGKLPQKNAQQKSADTVATKDSISVNVVKSDDHLIKAGENFTFTVTLDKAPNYSGSGILFRLTSPTGQIIQTSLQLVQDKTEDTASVAIPPDAPGGTWQLTIFSYLRGMGSTPIDPPIVRTFQVVPNSDLIFPKVVSVTVNPSQQQLLRRGARNLSFKIQNLKEAVATFEAANQAGKIPETLRNNLQDALVALQSTEAEFEKLATAQGQSKSVQVFFDDLRLNYDEVLQHLHARVEYQKEQSQLVNANLSDRKAGNNSFALLVQASLRPMEGNVLAYNVVADGGSLTFSLKVTSNPAGATVSYYRRGDSPHPYPEATNVVIPSLPYAIWFVKVEKNGLKPEVREFNPFQTSDRTVNVELNP